MPTSLPKTFHAPKPSKETATPSLQHVSRGFTSSKPAEGYELNVTETDLETIKS